MFKNSKERKMNERKFTTTTTMKRVKNNCEWGNARNGKRRLKSMNARCERKTKKICDEKCFMTEA